MANSKGLFRWPATNRTLVVLAALLQMLTIATSASAWWDGGHMQIAYVAYKHLEPSVRDKADALLRLNPDYAKWIAGIPDDTTARLFAFLHAATWADDIKTAEYGYTRQPVTSSTASQREHWL